MTWEIQVEFFFDFISPYSYLAGTQMKGLSQRAKVAVQWRPFVLGGVFDATGNHAPINIKNKGAYMIADLDRWAQYYGVPFKMPQKFPMKTITALRMALVADEKGAIVPFSKSVFAGYFAEGIDISNEDALVKIANDAGLNGKALLERAGSPEIKDKLRANTDEAIGRGAFGAPTFFVGKTMFWGNDRIMLLEEYLKGEL